MKKYLLVLMLCAAIGCKKNSNITVADNTDADTPIVMGTGLPGTWELRTTVSGFTGIATTIKPGSGSLMIFTTDHYQRFLSGTLINQGTYKITQQYSIVQRQNVNTLVYDGVVGNILSLFDLNGNTLSLSIDGYDTGASIYERIK